MQDHVSRRRMLQISAGGAAVAVASLAHGTRAGEIKPLKLKGNVNHSACRWCYNKIPLTDICQAAATIGLKSIELVGPEEWPILKEHGLTCAMGNGAGMGITKGFNRTEHHDQLVADYERLFPKAAAAGIPSVICFPGNRAGQDDEEGLVNCAAGIKRLMKAAEANKVTLVMELLNSRVDHKDYQCDHTAWGAELCRKVGSDRFKLLYDIYHMQIMEGDLIRTIQDNIDYIGHFHTGGVPGRHEIDESQEIYYPAVMRAIVATGYRGFVGQEFIPAGANPIAALRKAVEICDV
ncbi:MAG: TIM barrel protein [Rhodopirellula sp.]|nr:TIM barrel protein [Rhodopirellula sp.]